MIPRAPELSRVDSSTSPLHGKDGPHGELQGAPDSQEGRRPPSSSTAFDLTAIARSGKLDPVIGRDAEIRRVSQVLTRRTKNNPVLIGEPGVGKTAVVEGLAHAHRRR